jgi:SAM-dependent methyltransferase
MHNAIALICELDQRHIDWILDNGLIQKVHADEVIIEEGEYPEAIHFVMEGTIGIYASAVGDKLLAVLGQGEIMGEISFLEDCSASASAVSLENGLLLTLFREKLKSKLEKDSNFAAGLYKAFAIVSSRRLNQRVGTLGSMIQSFWDEDEPAGKWGLISKAIDQFKELMQEADKEALKNDNIIPSELASNIQVEFDNFFNYLNLEIGETSDVDPVKKGLWLNVQREMLPYLLLTKTAERAYSKPRGYAGDFLTIEWIYQNRPDGSGRLGPLLDRCFLDMPPAKAVRNQRVLLAQEIRQIIDENRGSTARITSLACGPAQEIFDVYEALDNPDSLVATLIDLDSQALSSIRDKAERLKLISQIKLISGNLIYLAAGRENMDVHQQDLVYSIGLINHFQDKFVIALLNFIYNLLRSGGKVILCNFHPNNPSKAFMDHILEWKLVHRTEEDMNRLFASSAFKKPCTEIKFEYEGINLFATCLKP